MLRSSNPILSKRDAFTPAAPQYGQQFGQQPYQSYPGQGGGFGAPQDPRANAPHTVQGRMTLDDVITKTAVTIAVLVVTAALAWNFVPDSLYFPAMILSALVGFGVVLLVSFRRSISPTLVVLYAAIEGVFIGMISKVFESVYSGIVAQAVVATFVAAGVTLAAYKFFNIRVTAKFTKVVFISTAAFAGLMLINFIFSLVTGSGGLRSGITGPVSGLSLLVSAVAVVLAVLNLVLDFDYVERGIAIGAPADESWRAAFGLTVTMVWLYIELLRLTSYIRR
ncbi:MAG: Bax inhibitor-1/YccA family protein [Janthinobacterium lividum]